MIKRILWFIGLKIAELVALYVVAVMGPHWLGRLVHHWTGFLCEHDAAEPSCEPMWMIGVVSLVIACWVCAALIFIIALLHTFIVKNWKWAGDLNWKFRKKG